MSKALTYYFDEALKKRYPVNEEGNPIVDWNESIPGKSKERLLWVKNETEDNLVLRQPYTLDEDLHIRDFPARLMRGEKSTVKLELALNKNRVDAHKAGWGFEVVVG